MKFLAEFLVSLYVLWRFSRELPAWWSESKRYHKTLPHWVDHRLYVLKLRRASKQRTEDKLPA